ncbi:hypothetical protein FQN57_002968 [Myotisia sp. PD_48]|nr:hypothetical protein FQN57_002968 [Myotisia sp. PD_48]
MPPRFSVSACLQPLNKSLCTGLNNLSLDGPVYHSSRTLKTKAKAKQWRRRDPFAISQAKLRKAANVSRQSELKEQRTAALGDPVFGDRTPFIEALLNPSLHSIEPNSDSPLSGGDSTAQNTTPLNYLISPEVLQSALEVCEKLTRPVPSENHNIADPQQAEEALIKHKEDYKHAEEAIRRILALENGNTKDGTRLNIQQSIEKFGRHNTDRILSPKPPSILDLANPDQQPALKERAGPDTGSAEVQISILTAKILVLANQLRTTSHKDKHNKRSLRLYVHKRQKLLKYLRRKERGGPRWQNLMNTLGLRDASWKGEIAF